MKRILFVSLFCLIACSSSAQIFKSHEENKFKFYGTLDFRNTIIDEGLFGNYGIKLGVGNKSMRFGGSYHIFHKSFLSIFTSDNFFTSPTVSHHQIKYHIASVFAELIIHQTHRWELILPVHIGIGKMRLNAYNAELNHIHIVGHDLDFREKEEWVESAVVSVKANYRILKWAGVTTGFGYNHSFSSENTIQSNFSYLFYSFGIKLFFDEFGSMFKSKEYRKKYLWNPNFTKQGDE